MKTSSVEEFKEHAEEFLQSDEFIVIERDGRATGVYVPCSEETMPLEIKRVIFARLSEKAGAALREAGITEEEMLADFENWRNEQYAARRGR